MGLCALLLYEMDFTPTSKQKFRKQKFIIKECLISRINYGIIKA